MTVRSPLLAALAVLVLLSACAPSADDEARQGVEQLTDPVGYYPEQTGIRWTYLPDGAAVSEPKVQGTVEGPTILGGETWSATHLQGRGMDVRWFRQVRDDGRYLVREERPGTVITFDPPIQELPAPGRLRAGATWGGETVAALEFPEATEGNREAQREVSYRATVVDRRTVNVAAGEFDVFVIDYEWREVDESGDVVDDFVQQVWYAPYVGEVRTENGFFLLDANHLDHPREGDAAD